MVLTNEKRGGLSVVSFDRTGFKLYSRKFSNKLMQAPPGERVKTAPRTLFLLFANYNCFPITLSVGLRHTFHIIHLIETTVLFTHSPIFETTLRIGSSEIFSNNATISTDIWSVAEESIAMF
jgi:hypothetical protein